MSFSLHLTARIPQVAAELRARHERARATTWPRRRWRSPGSSTRRSTRGPTWRRSIAWEGRRPSASASVAASPQEESVRAFNEYLYDEQGFAGNRDRYDDPRNSFLNEVLDRRTGIPISLAVIYLEVSRRAGLRVDGVNFPGHFLLRAREAIGSDSGSEVVIIDPFHGGAQLSEYDCRQLLRQHVGDEAAFDTTLLAPATRHDIVVRMLVNLKRLYVRMRSFPQARFISSLLLTVDPSAISELRDRGLLAYHLQDFAAALRDLEEYLRLVPKSSEPGEPDLIAEPRRGRGPGEPAAGRRRDADLGAREDAAQARRRVQLIDLCGVRQPD